MVAVGIIANPASGKDIRRLVAHGSVFDNNEKVNIVRRVVLGLDAMGVDEILFMPDYYAIGPRALDGLEIAAATCILPMLVQADQSDSTKAAGMMAERGVSCLVTLGGDGTNRAVAKANGAIPVIPISTGTNNVFPAMVEGTIAGMAAGLVATGKVDVDDVTIQTKRLDVYVDGRLADLALVDAVVSSDLFIASRALWDVSKIRDIVVTQAEAGNIGMSSIAGSLRPLPAGDRQGIHVRLGSSGTEVLAPIAPGLIVKVRVEQSRLLAVGDGIAVDCPPCTIALDGEREIELGQSHRAEIRLSDKGPRVVNIKRCMEQAAQKGLFVGPFVL